MTSVPSTWYAKLSNTPYQGTIANSWCTWSLIDKAFGFVVVPALTPETPKARPIAPAKIVANKYFRRLARNPMKVLLSAAITGRQLL
jgi:hypothetical protein